MNPKKLTVVEHLEELRKRLFVCAVFFVAALFIGFYCAKPIIRFIQSYGEDTQQITLNAFNVADPLSVYLEVTFIVALVITSPVILYQLWAFITPGLHENERKATLKYIPFTFVLFVLGVCFAYFVLFPFVMDFMMGLSTDLAIHQTIGINQYFSFLFKLVIPFGFLFQLPVVVLFLSRLGILNPDWLGKFRKYSYFVLFVIAALIAPDPVSIMVTSIPLFILYEISVYIARIGYKKYLQSEQLRQEQEQEEEQKQQKQQIEQLLEAQRKQIEQMSNQN